MSRMQAPTSGAAIMVWVLPIITILLGLCWLGPATRLQSPAFTEAKHIMPMSWWGIAFVGIGLVGLACVIQGSSHAYLLGLCAGAGLFAWWTVLFVISLRDPQTSLSAPVLPLGWTVLQIATLSSLTQERRRP